MTRDDIIRMAREAGIWPTEEWSKEYGIPTPNEQWLPELERFAALVAAAERERLAAKFMEMHNAQQHRNNYFAFAARVIREEA
jgi:hypothetical protein